MKLTRRQFLIAAGLCAGSAYLGMRLLAPDFKNSFKELAKNTPQEFTEMGFVPICYTDKNTEKEVLIISEEHEAPRLRQKEASFIDFLIDKYKADSLGLEGIWGAPDPDIDIRVEKQFQDYIRGLDPEIITRESYLESDFAKYVKQESIACYGLEDKESYLKTQQLCAFMQIFALVREYRTKYGFSYDKINNIKRYEKFADEVRAKFPEENYPQGTLEKMTSSILIREDIKRFSDYVHDVMITQRNNAFARNIEHYMKNLNSERGIVIVGDAHVRMLPLNPVHEALDISSQIVAAPR